MVDNTEGFVGVLILALTIALNEDFYLATTVKIALAVWIILDIDAVRDILRILAKHIFEPLLAPERHCYVAHTRLVAVRCIGREAWPTRTGDIKISLEVLDEVKPIAYIGVFFDNLYRRPQRRHLRVKEGLYLRLVRCNNIKTWQFRAVLVGLFGLLKGMFAHRIDQCYIPARLTENVSVFDGNDHSTRDIRRRQNKANIAC